MADPIKASCRTGYDAWHHSGSRPLSAIKLVVLHSTEGGTAAAVARYFSTPQSGGSAHLVVDDVACYRCLPNTLIPWGAPGANTQGFHIEQCGYAKWTAKEWNQHKATLERAAYKTAYHCRLFKIPAKFLTAAQLKKGSSGITTHAEVSLAWPNTAGSHWDPGSGWPQKEFMALVAGYLKGLK